MSNYCDYYVVPYIHICICILYKDNIFSSQNVPPTVARHCARLPRRCTLINMFGIVWSLVEILSRAAGSRPLLDVPRSPPRDRTM